MRLGLLFTALMLVTRGVFGLELSDRGMYAIVHKDGHVTDFKFYVSWVNGEWNIERRGEDGTYIVVTCAPYCALKDSSPKDIERFFPSGVTRNLKPSCVHSAAVAFCSYRENFNPRITHHVLVRLNTPKPSVVRLKRIGDFRE